MKNQQVRYHVKYFVMQHPVTVPKGTSLLPAPAFFLPDTVLQNFFDFFIDKRAGFA